MENPLVSVIISTYNHKDYISQAVESVVMQKTTFPFEIIIGEDESNDGTREICIDYAEKYQNRIRLFLRSRKDVIHINGYPTGRHNFIENLKSSAGKYVALLPGDDYWTDPLKLQKQVDILENNPTIICCHHWQKIALPDLEGFKVVEAPKNGHGYLSKRIGTVKDLFENKLRIKSRTMMFRNIIDDDFFPSWFYTLAFGDIALNFLLGKHGDFYFIDEEMAVYRQTGNGVSTSGLKELGKKNFTDKHFKDYICIWDQANIYYEFKYATFAAKSVLGFYKTIQRNYPNSPGQSLRLLIFSVFEQKGSLNYKLVIQKGLLAIFLRNLNAYFFGR